MLEAAGEAIIICALLLPRYVKRLCCNNETHMVNLTGQRRTSRRSSATVERPARTSSKRRARSTVWPQHRHLQPPKLFLSGGRPRRDPLQCRTFHLERGRPSNYLLYDPNSTLQCTEQCTQSSTQQYRHILVYSFCHTVIGMLVSMDESATLAEYWPIICK